MKPDLEIVLKGAISGCRAGFEEYNLPATPEAIAHVVAVSLWGDLDANERALREQAVLELARREIN